MCRTSSVNLYAGCKALSVVPLRAHFWDTHYWRRLLYIGAAGNSDSWSPVDMSIKFLAGVVYSPSCVACSVCALCLLCTLDGSTLVPSKRLRTLDTIPTWCTKLQADVVGISWGYWRICLPKVHVLVVGFGEGDPVRQDNYMLLVFFGGDGAVPLGYMGIFMAIRNMSAHILIEA